MTRSPFPDPKHDVTANKQTSTTTTERSSPILDSAKQHNPQANNTKLLIRSQAHDNLRRDRHVVGAENRREGDGAISVLEHGLERERWSDGLVAVGDVDVETVVGDGGTVAGVAREDGELEVGGDGVGLE